MSRVLLIVLILLVVASLLVGAHVYLAQRLVLEPGLAAPWREALLGLLAGLGASLVLQPLAEVAPDWRDPRDGRPLAALLAALPAEALCRPIDEAA